MIDRVELSRGRRYSLYAIVENGKCHIERFFAQLTDNNRKKILSLLEYTIGNGTPNNEEKFKKLETRDSVSIFEFKAGQVRVLCVFKGRSIIVLTHGFIKQQQKTPRTEIDRAVRLLQLYNERFRNENT